MPVNSRNQMAESEGISLADQPAVENEEKQKLKYLDFVQVAAVYVVVCFSAVYHYAEENSGPLRPGVETVERNVRTVIGPLHDKFQWLSSELLKLADRKVEALIIHVDHHVPALLKQVWFQARRAPEAALQLVEEVQRAGLVDTAKTVYTKYEPTAEKTVVALWRSLNRFPLFSQVARIMIPTAAHWADQYNRAVDYAAQRGCGMLQYLPLVPVGRIAKMFGEAQD